MIDPEALMRRLMQVPSWRRERWFMALSELFADGQVYSLVEVVKLEQGPNLRPIFRAQDVNSHGQTMGTREWSHTYLDALSLFVKEARRSQLCEVESPLLRLDAASSPTPSWGPFMHALMGASSDAS